jgi:hypothetical protein
MLATSIPAQRSTCICCKCFKNYNKNAESLHHPNTYKKQTNNKKTLQTDSSQLTTTLLRSVMKLILIINININSHQIHVGLRLRLLRGCMLYRYSHIAAAAAAAAAAAIARGRCRAIEP